MDSNSQYPTMWTTGYIGNVKVSFTFPIRNEMEAYAQAKAITDKLLADGFTMNAPGLESGEKKELIGYVLRRAKEDGTPVIDLYVANERFTFRYVVCYLDTPEDIKAFETVTGTKLDKLPLYDGDRLERGNSQKSNKFIIKLQKDAPAIIKDNPDYNPEETDVKKKKPARVFIRWELANQAPPPAAQAAKPVFDGVNPPQAAADEAELRRKAQAELDNEAVNIIEAFYRPSQNGYGLPRWEGKARLITGSTIPVVLWTEDVNLIKKAGYQWKDTDNEGIEIPVITKLVGSERRIKSVLPMENPFGGKPAENANLGTPDANAPVWEINLPALYKEIGQRASSVSLNERTNTIQKMHREGEFAKVGSLGGAVQMVLSRLEAHAAKRKTA